MQSLGRARPVQSGIRRDPAPTRWQYRMQRLWLTPLFRVLCRLGLPLTVVIGMTSAWMARWLWLGGPLLPFN